MSRDRELRAALVSHLRRSGALHDDAVARALLAVPRDRFVPGLPLEAAYEDRAHAFKERDGKVLSSISQPAIIAQMLEMLEVRRGARVLEIGTGSGYNAALLGSLTGPDGTVTSVEIERDLAERARETLRELEIANVDVYCGDGLAISLGATFDRIVVTALVRDIPSSWWDALAAGGRLVAPLDLSYGSERVVAFGREGNQLHATQTQACSFLGLRSANAEGKGDIFFRNASLRYGSEPGPREPIVIVAMRSSEVGADFLARADVVVARTETIFALSFPQRRTAEA